MSEFILSKSTPESQGIPSSAVDAFLSEIQDNRLNIHGFMLIRHGKVVAEGYSPPFTENTKHRMYSISKSFTAVAIGMMITEGKLSLDSKVADFFPEYIPDRPHPYVLSATVRDLLMMSTFNEHNSYDNNTPDFTESFFRDQGPKHIPGCFFSYDTAATTVLCAIVEKLSGTTLLTYMCPVLDEIGFSKDVWCVETPEGRSWTGSGILCTMRDLALFAKLCLNLGQWNGRQLLDREFMKAATSKQIDNTVTGGSPERCFGYGYQIWCMNEGGFAMYGMGSQYALCMPKYDTILITVGDTQGVESAGTIIHNAYYRLLSKISSDSLPEDMIATDRLHKCIASLDIPRPVGSDNSMLSSSILGKKYTLDENRINMKWLCLYEKNDKYHLQYENISGIHEFILGINRYEPFIFPEKYYGKRIGTRDKHYNCIGAAAWAENNTLLGTVYSIDDYLGSIHFQLSFIGNELCGFMTKNAEWFFDEYQGFISGTCDEIL